MRRILFPFVFSSFFLGAVLLLSGCAGHQTEGGAGRISSREVEIRLDLAEAYLRNNEPRLALQELNSLRSQALTMPRFHFSLGYTELMLGNGNEAVAAFRKTVALEPDHAEAWNNLGLALLAIDRPVEAEEAFARALAIPTYRTPEVAALNLSHLHLDQDRQELAMRYVHLALELNWRFTKAYLLAAEIEMTRGNTDQAIAFLKRGAEANLNDPQILLALIEYLFLAGSPDQALPWLEQLLATAAPDSKEAERALEYQRTMAGWHAASPEQKNVIIEQDIQEPEHPKIAEQPPVPEASPPDGSGPSPEDSSESAFIVQVGGFLEKNRAENLRETLKAKGYSANITEIAHRDKTWHLVFIAATQSRPEAVEIADHFKKQEKKDALVVKVGQGRYLD
jgi:Tfp pilus assembly protein PilF